MPVVLRSVVRRRPDLLTHVMDSDLVMADLETGNYFGLAGTARVVWDRLAEPVSVEELCDRLVADFDVSAADCQRDVLAFLDDLIDHELVERVA